MNTKIVFTKLKNEGLIIGRLLAGYADLELNLFHCVNVTREDFDTIYKAMFKVRGETRRIDMADIFGRQNYHKLGLGTQFEMAISSIRYCLKIRNQYSHCNWRDDYSGNLAFAYLEEIAEKNSIVKDLKDLTIRHVDKRTLIQQEQYFEYTDSLLEWVNFEGRRVAGKPSTPQKPAPKQLKRPPLYMHHE
ncbi:MAG TPA: hypothetical protein VMW42_14265 [Desulfatiglandales bacterium]|nr:hypothetical protein [Desulfatiglandales bacterium]